MSMCWIATGALFLSDKMKLKGLGNLFGIMSEVDTCLGHAQMISEERRPKCDLYVLIVPVLGLTSACSQVPWLAGFSYPWDHFPR